MLPAHVVQRLQVREARRPDLDAIRLVGAIRDEVERLRLGHRQLDRAQLGGVGRHDPVHERVEPRDDPVEVGGLRGSVTRGHELLR